VPHRGLTYRTQTRCDRECRNARTSSPGVVATVWHSVLKVCVCVLGPTPLVVILMQAVSAGPRRALRPVLAAHLFLVFSSRIPSASAMTRGHLEREMSWSSPCLVASEMQ